MEKYGRARLASDDSALCMLDNKGKNTDTHPKISNRYYFSVARMVM